MKEILEILKNIWGYFKSEMENNLINQSNLEIETLNLNITSAGQIVQESFRTRSEHRRIVGVFVEIDSNSLNFKSEIKMRIDGVQFISNDYIKFITLNKSSEISVRDASWRVDKKIDVSDIEIFYKDGNTVSPPYIATVNLICEKAR